MAERSNVWKLAAIGVVVAAASALVTGIVVANRVGVQQDARAQAPAAAPAAVSVPAATPSVEVPRPVAPPSPPAAEPRRVAQTPPQSAVNACNKQADAMTGGQRDRKGKLTEIVKDGAIGALGGAAVGALGGAIADGGSGAGKGALIGGAVGAGGGSLYGIYNNKKNDERYRSAYASCMRSKGYTS